MAPSTACASASGSDLGQLARILALGEGRDADLDLVLLLPLVEALGRPLTGVVGVERQHHPAGVRFSSRTWSSVNAVPHVATARGRPARWNPITSVYPSHTITWLALTMSAFAQFSPYSVFDLV